MAEPDARSRRRSAKSARASSTNGPARLTCQANEPPLLLGLGDGKHRPLRDADRSQHLDLVLVSVVLGFVDRLRPGPARPPPPLAAAAAAGRDRRPLHDPQHRLLPPAAADHRPRPRRPRSSPSPPTRCRSSTATPSSASPTSRLGQGRGPRHGHDRAPAPLEGRAAAGDAGDHRRAADRHASARSRSRPWRSSPAPAGSATQIYSEGRNLDFPDHIIIAGGSRS